MKMNINYEAAAISAMDKLDRCERTKACVEKTADMYLQEAQAWKDRALEAKAWKARALEAEALLAQFNEELGVDA